MSGEVMWTPRDDVHATSQLGRYLAWLAESRGLSISGYDELWIMFTERGSCVITGRSDATLNRGGVRLGTGELYAVVEHFPEVVDSLIVHLEDHEGGPGDLLLFVVMGPGHELDDVLRARIAKGLRDGLSPRHVPDAIEAVPAIPRTFTAKKLELPVKRILQGARPEEVASRDALAQPEALDAFVAFAARRRASDAAVA
jgi:acetoacetyl-CoA synthetase